MATLSLQGAYDQTRSWIESNDPTRAIGLAQHVLAHYPKNLEAYRILGEAYLASRQLDQAQEAFERVLRSDPENIPAHVGLGITYERQGKLDRAVPEFEQAWEIKPDMAELRSQLLRLYSEAWGSEHAQLRLSRAGLARLYAKGHMLPQAITEFRQVIADQPNRHDAKIALAEALWRDGQEHEAIALSREILAQQPDSLKANLLLGYLLLAQGQPEGQQYWDAATAIDPQMTVAQAMFETLPAQPQSDLELPEWDEAAWQHQQELDRQPVPAATRPIPVAEFEMPASTPARQAPVFANANNDDFLAVLLGGGAAAAASQSTPAPIETSDDPIEARPFSLDEIDVASTTTASQQAPAEPSATDADEPNLQPFSLQDLGLSDDEIASFDQPTDQPAATTSADDEPVLTPFSLQDLGLSDDEVADFNSATITDQTATQAPAAEEDEPNLTPFSLQNLGLSDDEITGFNSATTQETTAQTADADESTLTPFSLQDLGLSEDEIASLNDLGNETTAVPTPSQADDGPKLTPFSLDDLGLSDDEIAGLNLEQTDAATQSMQAPMGDQGDLPAELRPFSLDDLDISSGSSLPPSLQPFSLDEAPPEQPRVSNFSAPETTNRTPDPIDEEDTQTGGYSWQQPTQRTRPSYIGSTGERDPLMPEGESIFSKLKQRREREGDLAANETPLSSDDPIDDRILFSADDVSLRDDTPELDLSSAAAIGNMAQTNAPASDASPSDATSGGESEDLNSGIQSGQIQPFSLSDLGLSSEEIAALGLGGNSGTAQSFTSMLGDDAPTGEASVASQSGETAPATSDTAAPPEATHTNEIPSSTKAAEDDSQSEIGSLTPFSFSDLGLTDEEIAALGLEDTDERSGLGITEEELAGLDMGGDIDLSSTETTAVASDGDPLLDRLMTLGQEQGYVDIADIIAGVDNPEAEAERIEQIGQLLHENNIKIFDGDEEVDMDAEYAADETDLSQIDFGETVAPTSNEPDMTPFSLADLGLSDEEIASLGLGEPSASTAPATNNEPDPTPFSFADLGLTDDEIASLGLNEQTSASATNTNTEPEATPFSFADLNLNDDEVASLNLGETNAAPTQTTSNDEPALTPFSLADLGLTDEEIASLGLEDTQPSAAEETGNSTEPETTPFSFGDLGLSDDEIASLNLEEQATTSTPASNEPEMTPFSLQDLGLTDDKIAGLDLGETQQATEPTASTSRDEPDMTPFSFADLGLTDDEIASLGLNETETTEPPADQPATEAFSLDSRLGETATPEPEVSAEPAPQAQIPVSEPPAPPTPELVLAAALPLVQPRTSPGLSNSLAESVPALGKYLQQLDADPQNHTLRLSLARISGQLGQTEASIQQYRNIVRQNVLLDIVAEDLGDLMSDTDDVATLQRLHRLLGDVYSKQGRIDEAINEYNWTLGK